MPSKSWPNLPPPFADQIESALAAGNKIEAIKLYREATGAGLREAKEAIEGNASSTPRPTQSGHTSNWPGVSNEASSQIDAAISRGNRIEAIRIFRQATNCGLKEAKEAIERGLPPDYHSRHPSVLPVRALITFIIVIALIFAFYFLTRP